MVRYSETTNSLSPYPWDILELPCCILLEHHLIALVIITHSTILRGDLLCIPYRTLRPIRWLASSLTSGSLSSVTGCIYSLSSTRKTSTSSCPRRASASPVSTSTGEPPCLLLVEAPCEIIYICLLTIVANAGGEAHRKSDGPLYPEELISVA